MHSMASLPQHQAFTRCRAWNSRCGGQLLFLYWGHLLNPTGQVISNENYNGCHLQHKKKSPTNPSKAL